MADQAGGRKVIELEESSCLFREYKVEGKINWRFSRDIFSWVFLLF